MSWRAGIQNAELEASQPPTRTTQTCALEHVWQEETQSPSAQQPVSGMQPPPQGFVLTGQA